MPLFTKFREKKVTKSLSHKVADKMPVYNCCARSLNYFFVLVWIQKKSHYVFTS